MKYFLVLHYTPDVIASTNIPRLDDGVSFLNGICLCSYADCTQSNSQSDTLNKSEIMSLL